MPNILLDNLKVHSASFKSAVLFHFSPFRLAETFQDLNKKNSHVNIKI